MLQPTAKPGVRIESLKTEWRAALIPWVALLVISPAFAQPQSIHHDESKVPHFSLPDPLTLENGETVKRINTVFPHWFCKNFHHYNDSQDALPVDQHMLAALIAPRPLYVASAEQDRWADPRGEFLSLQKSSPVYELLGRKAMSEAEIPAVDKPLLRDVAYHIRSGKHGMTLYDWQRYMGFADQQFGATEYSERRKYQAERNRARGLQKL